ncbi:hypothetical protein M3Y95_01252100 [Aphelenchoides besseyi]|nr:hypothetical protein M3Y95_01252100 [Aphelenchoides besseyi]
MGFWKRFGQKLLSVAETTAYLFYPLASSTIGIVSAATGVAMAANPIGATVCLCVAVAIVVIIVFAVAYSAYKESSSEQKS